MTVGDRIRMLREEKGITQMELSRLSKVKQSTIANYESNVRKTPKKEIVARIAAVLGKDVNYILTGVEQRETIIDSFVESLVQQGVITSPDLDEITKDMILKVVEAKLIKLTKDIR